VLKTVYTAAPHFQVAEIPAVFELKAPVHLTGPSTRPLTLPKLAGTGKATPVKKISSLPPIGTIVFHVLLAVSNVVTEHAAFGSKVTVALGTATVYVWSAVNVRVEPLNEIVAPVLGIPLAVKFALNQI